jgi:O-methyltransferase involved in polyketide biosynthesis
MSEKIALTQEKETLLITLYAKAGDSTLPGSALKDRWAAEAVSHIEYDFSRLSVERDMMVGVALRALIFDGFARDFLARHREATVLHLGCGLDSRVFRLDPPASVRWFDVDYPDVIALRRRLYPPRDGYILIGSSVTDPAWLDDVPADRPALVLAEGLLMYVEGSEAHALIDRLTSRLPGGEIAFDAFSRQGLRMVQRLPSVRATGATLRWSVEDPADIVRAHPRLALVKNIGAYDPSGYDPAQLARMSWKARFALAFCRLVPALRNVSRIMRFRF